MRKKQCYLLIFSILLNIGLSAQESAQLDSLFTAFHTSGLFDGTALVADSNGIIYHQSFGTANHSLGLLNRNSSIYRIGSLEKQFTALLILQLADKGHLNLNAKVSTYLPKYRKDNGGKVSIEQLLTHTSGIPNYTALPGVWEDSLKHPYPPEYILQHFCSGNLEFEPGTKYRYSNTGYFMLAMIIEKITGKPLDQVLKENILQPAGMQHSGLLDGTSPIKEEVIGYYRLGNKYVQEPAIYSPNALGAASMYSTAYDLFLWDRFLYGNNYLSPAYIKAYSLPQYKIDPGYAYGYGWEFTSTFFPLLDTVKTMEHSGAIRAFRAVIFRLPAEKKCIILLSNSANQSGYELFENSLLILNGKSWKQPKKLLSDTLYAIMQSGSANSAVNIYRKWKKSAPGRFDYSTASLEFMAERLMLLKEYENAIAIYSLAVEEDPQYSYGYFYMGKAYGLLSKWKEARSAYQKAVDLDKNSRAGIASARQISYIDALNKPNP